MKPPVTQLADALRLVGGVLEVRTATYCFEGRFAFALEGGWKLVISPDDAERFRVDACFDDRVHATMWCLADDRERLAELAASMRNEATAFVA